MKSKPYSRSKSRFMALLGTSLIAAGCAPSLGNLKTDSDLNRSLPAQYPIYKSDDATKPIEVIPVDKSWQVFFADPTLTSLITLALKNNQDMRIVEQEISIASAEISARRGGYWPRVGFGAIAGVDKVGKYTSRGVSDATSEYAPGKVVPEVLRTQSLGLTMSWEIDIWKRLRNSSKAAYLRYISSVDGKNFRTTQLVSEVANAYYELMAYDTQLEVINSNIELQTQALEIIKAQREAARVTSLPVKRFETEVLKNKSRQFELKQKIVETENRINLLVGRFPQPIERKSAGFTELMPKYVETGVPIDLLTRRPDVHQAEFRLQASKLDVKAARARFYPSLSIEAGAGYESFNSKHLFSPESIFYNIAGNLTAPLLNRSAIRADYLASNAKQIQAVYEYEKTIIAAYTEVVNQLSMIENVQKMLELKSLQVTSLSEAVEISTILYKAARADYGEVLLTRRDALDAQLELIEIKRQQLATYINLYRSLGGGWNG